MDMSAGKAENRQLDQPPNRLTPSPTHIPIIFSKNKKGYYGHHKSKWQKNSQS
jgi:hypothetical protein